MGQLLLHDMDDELLLELQQHATENGVSAEVEAKLIINHFLEHKRRLSECIQEMDEYARRIGPQTIDSVDIIREERDRL